MCFSAEASFTIGSVLTVIGIATIKKTANPAYRWIAVIPLLFGFQQLIEGVVWIHMSDTLIRTPTSVVAQMIFLLFGWVIWPTYVPLAFLLAEKDQWRKKIFYFSLAIGVYISLYDLHYLLTEQVTARIVGYSIDYGLTQPYANGLYALATLVPIFLSSIPKMWVFGACLLVSFIVSQIIYALAFTSVWCFFCAAVSILLLKILSAPQEQQVKAAHR